jgi:hypothetical protein
MTTEQCAYVTIADAILPGNIFNPVLPLFSTMLNLYYYFQHIVRFKE